LLLSLPFLSCFLGCPGVLAIVEENGLEKIIIGGRGFLGEALGDTPANLLSSSGLIDLLSPNIKEVAVLLRGYSSWCLLDDQLRLASSLTALGKNFPFTNRWVITPSDLRPFNGTPAYPNNV
jgi:hypothetical protein